MLTQKHFEFMARIIAALDVGDAVRRDVATRFAAELWCTNPRFDRARFVAACGVAKTESA